MSARWDCMICTWGKAKPCFNWTVIHKIKWNIPLMQHIWTLCNKIYQYSSTLLIVKRDMGKRGLYPTPLACGKKNIRIRGNYTCAPHPPLAIRVKGGYTPAGPPHPPRLLKGTVTSAPFISKIYTFIQYRLALALTAQRSCGEGGQALQHVRHPPPDQGPHADQQV